VLRSRYWRAGQHLIVAFGHTLVGGDLFCDVVLVAANTPEHPVKLVTERGEELRVRASSEWFGQPEDETHYAQALEVIA
jgi:hypothetical protein